MKKYSLLIFLMLLVFTIQAQNTDVFSIKDPIIDSTLTIGSRNFLSPLYIVNKKCVIYQKDYNTRIDLNADLGSFRFPKHHGYNFALDKNGVYFKGEFVATDTTGFEIVGTMKYQDYKKEQATFWKTKDKLFLNTTEIKEGIDVRSFTRACNYGFYFKDKDYIYYGHKKIKGSNAESCSESLNVPNTIYDKNYVYINGDVANFEGDTLRPVNHFLIKTSKVVLTLYGHKIQPEIDVETIKPLSKHFSMDKNFIYLGTNKTEISPENFNNVKVWDTSNSGYISDGITINSEVLSVLDAKTFGVVPRSAYVYDKNGIYTTKWDDKFKKSILIKLPLNYNKTPSKENTFISNNFQYLIYENQAFDVSTEKIYKELTQEQITIIREQRKDILLINNKIHLANRLDYLLYEANGKIYWDGKETIADAETFERFLDFYRDKNNVYKYIRNSGLHIIKKLDTKNLEIDIKTIGRSSAFFVDKNYVYINTYRTIKNKDLELLVAFEGRRPGCGSDTTPSSDYYLFKNDEGYWIVYVSNEVKIKNLGYNLDEELKKVLNLKHINLH